MTHPLLAQIDLTLAQIAADDLSKVERPLSTAQSTHIQVGDRRLINLCANNYLGLADDPRLVTAAMAVAEALGAARKSVKVHYIRKGARKSATVKRTW